MNFGSEGVPFPLALKSASGFEILKFSFQGVWHVAWYRRQPKFWNDDLEKSEITGGFLNSVMRNLHCFFLFFFFTLMLRIANFYDLALFKLCGLIIKSVIGLCVLYFDGLVFGLCSWSQGVPQRCLRINGLWEQGGGEGEERTSWYSAGASNSPPHPVHPEQLQFLSFIYWNSK